MQSIETLTRKLNNSFTELKISQKQQASITAHLNLIKNRSEETWKHSVRVGLTSKAVAEYICNVNPKALYYPGLLHDVGKTLTSLRILNKIEKFSKTDREKISKHPMDSYQILKGTHYFSARVSLMHHNFQGKRSYPKYIPKCELNLSDKTNDFITYCAEIVSLVDFYDAATFRKNNGNYSNNQEWLSNEKVKTELIKFNPDQKHLINSLYGVGIFGRRN